MKRLGFDDPVVLQESRYMQIDKALTNIWREAKSGKKIVLVCYYAGHGEADGYEIAVLND